MLEPLYGILRHPDQVQIPASLAGQIARHPDGRAVVKHLPKKVGNKTHAIEHVVLEAVTDWNTGKEVLELLVDREGLGDELLILRLTGVLLPEGQPDAIKQ
jgi:hypothetical protein